MSEYPFIAFTALLIMGFGLFSGLAERSPITAPMIFVAVGIMVSPVGLSLLEANIDTVLVRVLLFGSIMVSEALPYWDAKAWSYALLSLTIVRMAPVAISLLGTNLDWRTILFIGWCGPRGIASVLYVLIVVLEIGLPGHEYALSVIVLTVLLSVVLHGISAMPLARLYGARTMNLESLNGRIKTS